MNKLKTLKDIVTVQFEKNKDKIAFIEKEYGQSEFKETKFSKVKEDILNLGTSMYENPNIKGKKVAVIGENSSRWFITYMAVVSGVGVIVPLDKELPYEEIINLINRADVSAIVYSNKKMEVIDKVKQNVGKNIEYIKMYQDDKNSDRSIDDLIAEGKDIIFKGKLDYINEKINPDSIATLIFTSGTSSSPKGVMLTNKNLIANVRSISEAYSDIVTRRYISFLPIHHTYEFTITYLEILSSGGSVGICRGIKYLVDDLKIIKPECICCVPLLVEKIKKKIEKSVKDEGKEKLVYNIGKATEVLGKFKTDVRRKLFKKIHENFGGNLKYILCGAAAIKKETSEYMESLGFVMLQGYGLTEASPLVAGTRVKGRTSGTVGTSIPGVEVRIDLKDNESGIGQIIVKGDNVMRGYYEDEKETSNVLKKGWLYTGDLGRFDTKGNLIITGRCKNVVITNNGKNIYPEELEEKVDDIPFVSESMVYGYADKSGDIIVTARVTLDEEYMNEKYKDSVPSDDEIYDMIWQYIKIINHSVPQYKAIKRLEIKKDKFIKTTTQKIKRFEEIKNKV